MPLPRMQTHRGTNKTQACTHRPSCSHNLFILCKWYQGPYPDLNKGQRQRRSEWESCVQTLFFLLLSERPSGSEVKKKPTNDKGWYNLQGLIQSAMAEMIKSVCLFAPRVPQTALWPHLRRHKCEHPHPPPETNKQNNKYASFKGRSI